MRTGRTDHRRRSSSSFGDPLPLSGQKRTRLTFVLCLALACGTVGFFCGRLTPQVEYVPNSGVSTGALPAATTNFHGAERVSLDRLLASSDPELERVDPLIMNLAVAQGLPEFANLDVDCYARQLDAWAGEIKHDTERHYYRFVEKPEDFKHSEIEYKISWLASDINAVFKIDYDLEDFDAARPENLFLNGLVDRKVGTCVSMPLLYVALGWRLGYPIKLVAVPTHLFARWDDGVNRVNIEATGYGGELSDEEYAAEFFVSQRCRDRGAPESLTPRQMLAQMILARAHCWARRGNVHEHLADALRANLLDPEHPLAILELEQAWQRRAELDEYFAHAGHDLLAAVAEIDKRDRASAGKPLEKLIFTDIGPMAVTVDRKP